MVRFQKPDWKCVFTYVQSFYRRFRNGRSPSPRPGDQSSQGGEQAVKLSEVALAVAECQAAQEKGRQIVKTLSKDTAADDAKQGVKAAKENSQQQLQENEENNKLEKQVEESKNEDSCLKIEEAKLEDKKEEESKKEELHTQVASITLKPSNLSPGRSSKMVRSKSLNQDHPQHCQEEKGNERKFSVNHPMPSVSPPALKL